MFRFSALFGAVGRTPPNARFSQLSHVNNRWNTPSFPALYCCCSETVARAIVRDIFRFAGVDLADLQETAQPQLVEIHWASEPIDCTRRAGGATGRSTIGETGCRIRSVSDGMDLRVLRSSSSSAISFAAIADAEHAHGFFLKFKANTVIADAEPILGRIDVLKLLHVSCTSGAEALNGHLDPSGIAFIEFRHILQRCLGLFNLHPLQTQPAHSFLMRNASAAVQPDPLPGLRDLLFFFVGLRFVVDLRMAQRADSGIDDCFEKSYQCRKQFGSDLKKNRFLNMSGCVLFLIGLRRI